MAKNSLVTANDLNALSSYSERQRAQVLCCYLLDPNRFNMQEVAQKVLRDDNDQAGQRVSLITRSYGFSARNAGRYAGAATEQDVWDFVRSYQPERCGGLPEGSFDEFLRARQARREAEHRREQARLQAQRQQEQARREEEARYRAEQARLQQEEQRRIAEERRRQEEQARQEMRKKQRAEALRRQAEQYWQNGPGPGMAEGIRLFQEAMSISWREEENGYMRTRSFGPTPPYCVACANMTEYCFDQGNIVQALTYGGCLDKGTHMDRDGKTVNHAMLNSEAGLAIGRGYAVLATVYLDRSGGYYDAQKGQEAAETGMLCKNAVCVQFLAQCYLQGIGTNMDLEKAAACYDLLSSAPQFKDAAEEQARAIRAQIFQQTVADVRQTLAREAPDAFPMLEANTYAWPLYKEQVLDLPALWTTYRTAHSSVETKGLLFKKKEYHYDGRLTQDLFNRCCQSIWETRRNQFNSASPDYVPCPRELAMADDVLQRGLERMKAHAYSGAADLLLLPAMRGSVAALRALAEVYTSHISDRQALANVLSLLEAGADGESIPLLVRGYARLGRWKEAIAWGAKGGEALHADIRAQAAQWADRVQPTEEEAVLKQALWVRQEAGDPAKCAGAALMLAQRTSDEAQKRQYLEQAAEWGSGEASYQLALLEIAAQGDPKRIRDLLERADGMGALPDRELLARQYASGPEEARDYIRALKIYLDLPEITDTECCISACLKSHTILLGIPQEERPWELMAGAAQKILDLDSAGRYKRSVLYILGTCYNNGLGVEKDFIRGMNMMEESARQGYPQAVCCVARFHAEDGSLGTAAEWLEKYGDGAEECEALLKEVRAAQEQRLEEVRKAMETARWMEELYLAQERNGAEEAPESSKPVEDRTSLFGGEEPSAGTAGAPEEEAREETEVVRPSKEAEGSGRKDAKPVTGVRLAGEELAVKNATQAVTVTFQRLLQTYPDRLEDCLREISQLTDDGTRNNSVFRKKNPLEIGGRTVWVGVSTGFALKCTMAGRLCAVLGLPAGTVVWLGPEGTVYENS